VRAAAYIYRITYEASVFSVNKRKRSNAVPLVFSRLIYFLYFLYGWMPHNAGFGFLDLTPSILLLRQFWD
jgi:hypothetical protein